MYQTPSRETMTGRDLVPPSVNCLDMSGMPLKLGDTVQIALPASTASALTVETFEEMLVMLGDGSPRLAFARPIHPRARAESPTTRTRPMT